MEENTCKIRYNYEKNIRQKLEVIEKGKKIPGYTTFTLIWWKPFDVLECVNN